MALKGMTCVIRSAGIYLRRWGHCDEERFARLIVQTWRRIPLGSRRRIVRHLRQNPLGLIPGRGLCCIEAFNDDGDNWRKGSYVVFGECSELGRALRFNAAAVDGLPDVHVQTLVAHELAHTFCFAVRGLDHQKQDEHLHPEQYDISCAEDEVSSVLDDWGFDVDGYIDATNRRLS